MRTTPLPVWIESFACKSGAHCLLCRGTSERGERFRATMGRGYVMPEECPHGIPMGATQGTIDNTWQMVRENFVPEAEVRRLRGGGCCGAPVKPDHDP